MENEQIILLLIKVNKNLKKLRKEVKLERKVRGREYNPDDWALMEEVLKKLSISKSTLYRYRQQKKLHGNKRAAFQTITFQILSSSGTAA